MATERILCLALVATGLLCTPSLAQSPTPATPPAQHIPLAKAIGETAPQIVPSLIVINSRGATLQDGKLTLTGVTPNTIVFADRPVRAAGHTLTTKVVEEWSPEQTFAEDPPNATISVFARDGAIRDAVVTLKSAKLDGERLTFDVEVLEGALTGGDGPASLFIDRFGFGGFHGGGGFARAGGFDRGNFDRGNFDRGNFDRANFAHINNVNVGVAGRPYVAGGAWYRGAAVGAGAVATGAVIGAAATAPYRYGYGYPGCGYYPNPPCY